MKRSMKWMSVCAAAAMLTPLAYAGGEQCAKPQNTALQSQTEQQGGSSQQQSFRASKLLGKNATDNQGQKLGKLSDISLTKDGQIFAVLDMGDNRYAPVPWQVIQIKPDQTGDLSLSLNTSKQKLESGPTLSMNQWDNLNKSSFTQQIYSHFGVQPSTAMGAPGSGSESTQGSDQSQQKDQDQDQSQDQGQQDQEIQR